MKGMVIIMKNRNWFLGFFFVLAAIFLIASQTGSFGNIGVLSILAGILLVSLMVQSIVSLNYFGIFMPIAFLYMIFAKPLDFVYISPWQLIIAAVLTSIGFSILFHTKPKYNKCWHGKGEGFSQTTETIDDNNPYAKVSFGSSSKYLHSDCLKTGQFTVSFGELEVFFDQARLDPNGAEIFLDCSFGAIKLYIPKHWRVQDSLHASLGGVDNNTRTAKPDMDSPILNLTGNVQLGGIEISYI